MTVHIGAKPGEIAETVLLPGDPYRAKWAAEQFLDNPVLVNEVRGMLGYTGTWNGHPVTIHGSGMGMPSLSIYVNDRRYVLRTDGFTSLRGGARGGEVLTRPFRFSGNRLRLNYSTSAAGSLR